MFEICVAILSHEDSEFFINFTVIWKCLKFFTKKIYWWFCFRKYQFFKKIFNEEQYKSMPCYFHLIQSLWGKANKLGLRNQKYAIKTNINYNIKYDFEYRCY